MSKETLNKLKIEPAQCGIKQPPKEDLNKLKIESVQYSEGIGVPFGENSNENVTSRQNDSSSVTAKKHLK
jgi:hypothetical protein